MGDQDGWFDEPEDAEFPGGDFDDDFDGDFEDESTETLPCPECGAAVYEDAVRCPECGTYITFRAGAWTGRPTWWILLALLGLVAAILAMIGLIR